MQLSTKTLLSEIGIPFRCSSWVAAGKRGKRRGYAFFGGIAAHLEMTVEINDEIKQKMVEYLQTFEAGVKKAGEFSAEQAPLVVQEFLAWEFWSSFVAFLICSLLIIITLGVLAWWWKNDKSDLETKCLVGLIPVLACVFMQIPVWTNAYNAGKVAVAPRIVVLEKISELVK